jgi:signal transduction histidine kinase
MAQTSIEIILEMQDTGSGIRAEDKRFIFDPFFSNKGKLGTGLGLWLVTVLSKNMVVI